MYDLNIHSVFKEYQKRESCTFILKMEGSFKLQGNNGEKTQNYFTFPADKFNTQTIST